jgi:RNA polymerase sigma-70 factor, ECF subfamily
MTNQSQFEHREGPRQANSSTVIGDARPDETAVVKLACDGDAEAFAFLYGKYRNRIHATCLRMIKDPFLAEDMLQETFLSAFRRIRTFRSDSLFSTWLHRIAVNLILMHFRRCKTSPIENANVELPNTDGDPIEAEYFRFEDRQLTHAMERIELNNAINSLPQGYRTMFVLHDIEGFQHTEIAAILNCSPGNTKSQLFKARKRLRKLLMDHKAKTENKMHESAAA